MCEAATPLWALLHSDLEKSVEELQRNSSVNHGLVTEQDVEQKSKELRMLGETLTELKSESGCGPASWFHVPVSSCDTFKGQFFIHGKAA